MLPIPGGTNRARTPRLPSRQANRRPRREAPRVVQRAAQYSLPRNLTVRCQLQTTQAGARSTSLRGQTEGLATGPAGADQDRHGHDEQRDWVVNRPHHAALTESKMVLATLPFPAKPMETKTGLSRPGTFTLSTRMEYAGEVAGHAVKPWRTRQWAERESVTVGSVRNPESTWTPFSGCRGVGRMRGQGGRSTGRASVLTVTDVSQNAMPCSPQMAPRPGVTWVRVIGQFAGTENRSPAVLG